MVISQTFIIAIIILAVIEILTAIRIIRQKEYDKFLWFCELSPVLLIIGFLSQNMQYIKGVINILLLPQLITLVMLVMVLMFDFETINFKGLKKKGIFYIFVSFLIHLVSVNMALYVTLSVKATPISLVYSAVTLAAVFILTYFFTDHKYNVNFIDSADFIHYKPRFYKYGWLIAAFLLLVLPTYFLQNWIVSLFIK